MKKIIRMTIVCIVMAVSVVYSGYADSTHLPEIKKPEKIRIVYMNVSNPPLILGEGTHVDADRPGTTIELLKLVARNLDLNFEFKRVPWKRAQVMLELNEADAIFHATFQKERLRFGKYPMKDGEPDPSRRLLNQSYVLYKLKNSPLSWDGKKFSNLNGALGAVIGYAIISDLKKMGITVEESKTNTNIILKVLADRLAGMADLETMADITLASDPEKFKNIVKVFPPLRNKPYYLICSHGFVEKYPLVAEYIWNEIGKVRESDEFQKVFIKYTR